MKKTLFASALALVFASTTAFAAPAVPPVPAHKAVSQTVTHINVHHKKEAHKNELHHKPVKKPVRKQVKRHYVKKQVKVNRGHPHIKGEHAKGQPR